MNIVLFSDDDCATPDCINDGCVFYKNDERYLHIKKILHLKEGDVFKAGIINGKIGEALISHLSEEKIVFSFCPNTPDKNIADKGADKNNSGLSPPHSAEAYPAGCCEFGLCRNRTMRYGIGRAFLFKIEPFKPRRNKKISFRWYLASRPDLAAGLFFLQLGKRSLKRFKGRLVQRQ